MAILPSAPRSDFAEVGTDGQWTDGSELREEFVHVDLPRDEGARYRYVVTVKDGGSRTMNLLPGRPNAPSNNTFQQTDPGVRPLLLGSPAQPSSRRRARPDIMQVNRIITLILKTIGILYVVLLVGGTVTYMVVQRHLQNIPWTAIQLRDWYSELEERPDLHGPLYYCGSDMHFHYFTIRSMDDFVEMKVPREEIVLEEMPRLGLYEKPFPGYYTVDPLNGFHRTVLDRQSGSFRGVTARPDNHAFHQTDPGVAPLAGSRTSNPATHGAAPGGAVPPVPVLNGGVVRTS